MFGTTGTALAATPSLGTGELAAVTQQAADAVSDTTQYAEAIGEEVAAQAAEEAEKQAYIEEWATRIDTYLAGSPLEGYGATFAEAAYANGVDPRWSPAISCIESSKGAVCFASHNAWGWGGSGWSSWEEAIWAHVSGLAAGYGSENSLEAAAKYCPPSYQSWYANVEIEMARI